MWELNGAKERSVELGWVESWNRKSGVVFSVKG